MSIKILGLDPGTGIMGWGIIEKNGTNIKPLKYGAIMTPANTDRYDRLEHIFDSLSDIINKNSPDEFAIESLFFFKNHTTVISVAEARGVALLAARKYNLPIFEYTPSQIKMAVTGYGRAEKQQVQEMVRLTCKLKECPKPDDAADAMAIAICHAQTSKLINGQRTSQQQTTNG